MFRQLKNATTETTVTIMVDGKPVIAVEGETVAGVLLRHSPLLTRTTPVKASQRAPYCMMGVCFECLAVVNGTPSTQTCLTTVSDGMRVERQNGKRQVVFNGDASGFATEPWEDIGQRTRAKKA